MANHIKPPRMRLGRRIKKDQVFKVKVRFEHPSFTGLGQVDTETSPAFNRAIPVRFISLFPAWRYGATMMPGQITVEDIYNIIPTGGQVFTYDLV